MKDITISLDAYFIHFVDAQVQTGRFGSISDVFRAGLRLLEAYDLKLKALQDALIAGEEDDPVLFDSEAFLKQIRVKHG